MTRMTDQEYRDAMARVEDEDRLLETRWEDHMYPEAACDEQDDKDFRRHLDSGLRPIDAQRLMRQQKMKRLER